MYVGRLTRLFQTQAQVDIKTVFLDHQTRKNVQVMSDVGGTLSEKNVYCYNSDEAVAGHVIVRSNKEIHFQHIVVELIGEIVTYISSDEKVISRNGAQANTHQFTFASEQIATDGSITSESESDTSRFFFYLDKYSCPRHFESFYGQFCQCRYYIQVKLLLAESETIIHKKEVFITCTTDPNLMALRNGVMHLADNAVPIDRSHDKTITLEVGLGEDLHFTIKFYKTMHHLSDVVLGKIIFKTNLIKLKRMEILFVRTEKIFRENETTQSTTETISKFEIMDGDPSANEMIPIRLYLSGIPSLTPTYIIEGRFSVTYLMNICLIDNENRRLFRQQDIYLFRKEWPNWNSKKVSP